MDTFENISTKAPKEMGRIDQSRIITEGNSQNLLQSVVCPICLLVLPLPHYTCEGCDNAFCASCLEEWWVKCPKACVFKCQNASFKIVKRSNTYNALMDVLAVLCSSCNQKVVLARLNLHETVECPYAIVKCSHPNCPYQSSKMDLQNHKADCQWGTVACQHCKMELIRKQLQSHFELECQNYFKKCAHPMCGKEVKAKAYQQHLRSCPCRMEKCEWCSIEFMAAQLSAHKEQCEMHTSKCKWCEETMPYKLFLSHQDACGQRKEYCQLCLKSVLVLNNKAHREECLWQTTCELKAQSIGLAEQNKRLVIKIEGLEAALKESEEGRQSHTLNTLKTMRDRERQEYEKDLLRLKNSMWSIEKLKKQEQDGHIHISERLCFVCMGLKKKYQQMMEPLELKREEILEKIAQFDHMAITPK